MKLGIIVRSDNTGLGIQTRSYYKHLKPYRTLIVDISEHNGNEQHYQWYENADVCKGMITDQVARTFLEGLDVVLTAETAYSPNFYAIARQMGVKTVCVENPEFYDHIVYPNIQLPDVIILPSVWKQAEITAHATSKGCKVVQLHHPVDRDEFKYIERTRVDFLHIAGKPATQDRNGTFDFMQACPTGTVTTQSADLAQHLRRQYRHSTVYTNINDPVKLYELGTVLVMPRKYGGNCLPLNEALSTGMPVIMPDISPNNNILPIEWLVPATITGFFEPRTRVDIYSTNIKYLYGKLEWLKTCDIKAESQKANAIADTISWKTLLPEYERVLYG